MAGVQEQFLKCGIPEAGRLLREQGESFQQQADAHAHTLMEVQTELYACQSRITFVLDDVCKQRRTRHKKSIDQMESGNAQGAVGARLDPAWLIGLFLGALMCWWVAAPHGNRPQQASVNTAAHRAIAPSGRDSPAYTEMIAVALPNVDRKIHHDFGGPHLTRIYCAALMRIKDERPFREAGQIHSGMKALRPMEYTSREYVETNPPAETATLLTVDNVAALLQVSADWVRDHATRKQPRLPDDPESANC